MRTTFVVLAAAGTALAQGGYVSQINDGQIQAPTGSASAPVESVEPSVAPVPYTSIASVSGPSELSSAYSAIATSASAVPLPSPINTTVIAPSYPAGNATAIAPTGSGAAPTTVQSTVGSPSGGSASESAGSAQQTGNGAGIVGVETGVIGAVFAGLLALLA